MNEYSLGTLVDKAKNTLPRRQHRRADRWQKAMQRRGEEAAIFDELESHLCSCSVTAVAMEARQAFATQCECEADVVKFGIDPDKLSAWLEVIADFIINKLPKILEVLLPLFMMLSLALCCFTPAKVMAEPVKPMPCFALDPATLAGDIATKKQVLAVVKERSVLSQFSQQADCPNGQCPVPVKAPVLKRVKSILEVATPASKRGPVRRIAYGLRQPMRKTCRFVAKFVAFLRPRNVTARMRSKRGC